MPKPVFPKTIYVTREGDEPDTYLNVRESADWTGLNESMKCAVYELKEVGIISVTRSFEKTRGR